MTGSTSRADARDHERRTVGPGKIDHIIIYEPISGTETARLSVDPDDLRVRAFRVPETEPNEPSRYRRT